MRKILSLLVISLVCSGSFAWADKKIDQLPAIVTPADGDLYYCMQSTTDFKCELSDIRAWGDVAITGGTIDAVDITNGTIDAADITNGTIVGPTIDNAVIGGSTPAAGDFTTLNTTGNVGIDETNPLDLLHVAGGGVFGSTLSGAQTAGDGVVLVENELAVGIIAAISGAPLSARKDSASSTQMTLAVANYNAAAAGTGPRLAFVGFGATAMGGIRYAWDGAATTDSFVRIFTRSSNVNTEHLRIDSSGNMLLGHTATPASATQSVAIETGTAPSGGITNGFVMYSSDESGGNAAPTFRLEGGDIVILFKGSALTAEDATVIDATYGSDEEGVLNNVRTRVGEIEVVLQAQGLLT